MNEDIDRFDSVTVDVATGSETLGAGPVVVADAEIAAAARVLRLVGVADEYSFDLGLGGRGAEKRGREQRQQRAGPRRAWRGRAIRSFVNTP